jgi:mannose-6-phosphate isomerase-like protein (cupin superfamily)
MIIRNEEMKNEVRDAMRGGPGSVALHHIVPKEALPAKSRLFALNTLQKGCGIGSHAHANETEVYFVLQGEGVLFDNGERKTLRKGDCNVCGGGATHSITNEKDEPLVFIAVIILE